MNQNWRWQNCWNVFLTSVVFLKFITYLQLCLTVNSYISLFHLMFFFLHFFFSFLLTTLYLIFFLFFFFILSCLFLFLSILFSSFSFFSIFFHFLFSYFSLFFFSFSLLLLFSYFSLFFFIFSLVFNFLYSLFLIFFCVFIFYIHSNIIQPKKLILGIMFYYVLLHDTFTLVTGNPSQPRDTKALATSWTVVHVHYERFLVCTRHLWCQLDWFFYSTMKSLAYIYTHVDTCNLAFLIFEEVKSSHKKRKPD